MTAYDTQGVRKGKKIAVVIGFAPIDKAIEMVIRGIGHTVVLPEDAEIVIADEPAELLAHLKRGREVIQLVVDPNRQAVASGLQTAPDFAGRFRAYQVVDRHKGVPVAEEMFAYLTSLVTEAK